MAEGEESYVRYPFTSQGYFPIMELYVMDDKGAAVSVEELYVRNALAPGGYNTIFINPAVAVPDVTIVSVTEPAVEGEDVAVIATTPAGTLTYQFQLDFSGAGTNWLTVQDGPLNTWTVPVGTEGFFWRVNVTADDGVTSDTETFNSSGRIEAPSDGALQTMQWVLTSGNSSGTVASTGLEIIDPTRTSQLEVNGGPRFWNGTEANNFGATNKNFDSPADCKVWWQLYDGRVRQNGRDWIRMTDENIPGTITAVNTQKNYNDVGNGWQNYWLDAAWWIPQAQGQTLDYEIYLSGQMPDNWYTHQLGAGTIESSGGNGTITYGANFPVDPSITNTTLGFLLSYNDGPASGFLSPANKAACADYVAWYVSEEEANSGQYGAAKTAGWYVYGPKVDNNPGNNSNVSWPPLAWPTGGSDGNGSGGQWNSAGNYQSCAAWLSSYTGATGNGGTDGWSAPYGSLLDWDTAGAAASFASDTTTAPASADVTYESNPGIMDQFKSGGAGPNTIEIIGYAGSNSLKLDMTATTDSAAAGQAFPYCAYWNSSSSEWRVGTAQAGGIAKGDIRYTMTLSYNESDDVPLVVMLFESDPGDVSKWRPYDGPTS